MNLYTEKQLKEYAKEYLTKACQDGVIPNLPEPAFITPTDLTIHREFVRRCKYNEPKGFQDGARYVLSLMK